jgi:hypothetical protein
LSIDPSSDDWSTHWHVVGDQDEGAAVRALLELHDEKLDHKIRQCPGRDCGAWFFGSGKYCSRECWTTAYRSTDEYKEKNKQYAKNYYDYWNRNPRKPRRK